VTTSPPPVLPDERLASGIARIALRPPVLPGRRYLDWPVTNPEGAPIAVVRGIRDEIDAHIAELLVSLPST
jgi:hypothetical protein